MTNGDKLRDLKDEELAEYLVAHLGTPYSYEMVLKWLKQETSDE